MNDEYEQANDLRGTKIIIFFFHIALKKNVNCIYYSGYFFFLRSTQGGEITVYGLTETAWQVSSVGLHVEKHRHDYRLKHPKVDKIKNNMSKGKEPISLRTPVLF